MSGERAGGRAFESRQERFFSCFLKVSDILKRMLNKYLIYVDEKGKANISRNIKGLPSDKFILTPSLDDSESVLISQSEEEYENILGMLKSKDLMPSKLDRFYRFLANYSSLFEHGIPRKIELSPNQRNYLGIRDGEDAILELVVGKNFSLSKSFYSDRLRSADYQ